MLYKISLTGFMKAPAEGHCAAEPPHSSGLQGSAADVMMPD